MNKIKYNDYDIRKTNIIERFLLLFKKPIHCCTKEKKINFMNYKHMFGRTYMIKEKINFKKNIYMEEGKMNNENITSNANNCATHE